MSNYIEEKLKEFDEKFLEKTFDSYQGWSFEDLEEIKQFIKQALQEQEERIIEEEYQRRKRVRSKTAEANYVAGYNEARIEMKEKLMQIVIEDVPHQYQERLLKELNI